MRSGINLSGNLAARGLAHFESTANRQILMELQITSDSEGPFLLLIELISSMAELWLSFWSEVHYNSIYKFEGQILRRCLSPFSQDFFFMVRER